MSTVADRPFVYVTYIRTTPEALWEALLAPEFTRRYWMGMRQEAEWRAGGAWRLVFPDGRVADSGAVLEYNPPRRLALRWRNEFKPELAAEGYSRCTFTLEPHGAAVKLTVAHEMEEGAGGESRFIAAVSGGWPQVLSNLKALLETGAVVVERAAA